MLIDQLPEITTANDADEMPIEQGTTTRKIKILNLLKGVVKKAGDTMTGMLFLRSPNIDINQTQSAWGHNYLLLLDKNDARVAGVRAYQSNGFDGIQISGHNGSTENALRLGAKSDGSRNVYVTDPAAWRSALGAMSQAGTDISGADTTSGASDYEGSIKTILTSNAPQSWAKGMYFGSLHKTNSGTQPAWAGMYILNVFNPNVNWLTQGLVVAQGYIFRIWYKNGVWDVLRFALA